MNETINELVDAIKEDQRYIDFINASKTLQEEAVSQLLNDYQTVLNEYNYLKQFDSYIDNSNQKNKLKKIKKEIANNEIIQNYYQTYYEINDLLDHITNLVFQNISDSLDTTGFKL